jgi:hypothetical protein
MVRCSHRKGGRCRLCFGEFLRGRLGGRQFDARALLGEVRPEPRGVLSPMASGVSGRRCTWTERAEAGSRALRGGEIGLASTTAHGRQWIGTASARGQRRAEHDVERVGVGGRWHGGVAVRGERGDEATRVLG